MQKSCHLGTIAQLCWAISSQLRHVSTIGKKLLSSNMSSRWCHNLVNFSLLAAEIVSLVWGTPPNFVSWQHYCTACSSGHQQNFAALNRGRHLCSAGRPSHWALAHISSLYITTILEFLQGSCTHPFIDLACGHAPNVYNYMPNFTQIRLLLSLRNRDKAECRCKHTNFPPIKWYGIKIVSEFKWLPGNDVFAKFTIQKQKHDRHTNYQTLSYPSTAQTLNPTKLRMVTEEICTIFAIQKTFLHPTFSFAAKEC